MRELLRSPSLSYAESVKAALLAAGIEAAVTGEALTGVIGVPFAVTIRNEEDLSAARAILAELEEP